MNDTSEDERESNEERKERVLHTRIPESLDGEIRKRAHALGLSVSTLVRNILSNTFGLVEDIVADGAALARSARGEGLPRGRNDGLGTRPGRIIGWQSVTLALNAVCGSCNEILKKGGDAAVAVTEGDGPKPVLCPICFKALKEESHV